MAELLMFINLVHWFTALLLFSLTVYTLGLRKNKVARALALFFFLVGFWALFAALIFNVPQLETKILLNRVKLMAPPFIPLSIVYLASTLDVRRRVPGWLWLLLLLIPTFTAALCLTPWHTAFVGDYELIHYHSFNLLKFVSGPWFKVHNFQARISTVLALFLLVTINQKTSRHHRTRIWLILAAIAIPLVADTISLWFAEILRYLQITPAVSLLTALIMLYAVLKHHILDLVPIARNHMLDSTNDLYVAFDEHDRLIDCNGPAQKILGLSTNLIGLPRDQIPSLASPLKDLPYQMLSMPFFGRQQEVLGRIVHFKEISAQKKIEAELEAISRMKTNMLAIMSHDILGNLSAVQVMIENLKRAAPDTCPEDKAATLENMQHCANNCLHFIEQLMLWSKSQMGVLLPSFSEVCLERVARDVLQFLQHDIIQKNIDVSVQSNVSQPIYSDANMLLVILRNLLSNAVKFTPENGEISLCFHDEGTTLRVSVEDSGQGLEHVSSKDIFNIERKKSSGLGLILCHEFVKFLGGRIWAENAAHKGARFFFQIPKSP